MAEVSALSIKITSEAQMIKRSHFNLSKHRTNKREENNLLEYQYRAFRLIINTIFKRSNLIMQNLFLNLDMNPYCKAIHN